MKIPSVFMVVAVLSVSGCANRLATLTAPPRVNQWLSECGQWDEWEKPGPAFRIHGNTYYVGTCGIASMLIATDRGHVLIDSGTREGAEHVVRNIESLGLRVTDIRLLLHSHEHFDHVGGLSYLQRLSGARLLTSEAASQVLATGMDAPGDPQYGLHPAFAAARVDGSVRQGERIHVGGVHFTVIETPGHTPGALSWHWQSCDELSCVNVVYADSLSPISRDGYRFSDDPDYVEAFRAGLDRLAQIECDILVTPHPSASLMVSRLRDGALADSSGCERYAESIRARLELRLSKEHAIP